MFVFINRRFNTLWFEKCCSNSHNIMFWFDSLKGFGYVCTHCWKMLTNILFLSEKLRCGLAFYSSIFLSCYEVLTHFNKQTCHFSLMMSIVYKVILYYQNKIRKNTFLRCILPFLPFLIPGSGWLEFDSCKVIRVGVLEISWEYLMV